MRNIMLIFCLLVFVACSGNSSENNKAAAGSAQESSDIQLQNISADSAYAMMQRNADNPNFVVLDVRTPGEFQSGHLANAIDIDFRASDFKQKVAELDKDKTYLIHCRSGNRSGQALPVLKELGFKKIYHLNRGMIEWNERDLPVVTE